MGGYMGMVVVVCVIVVQMQVAQMLAMPMPPLPQPGNFSQDFEATGGAQQLSISNGGHQLQLSLDCSSGGSGVKSKKKYLFANIALQMKLVLGDSAGTVTSYFFSSGTQDEDGLQYQFLGNAIGKPYTVQTNVVVNGVGGREQRIHLWFDPAEDFHTYRIFWTPGLVVFLIDAIPIRVFNKINGQPYLDKQYMQVYSSIWNGDNWATRGGLEKINCAGAPFITSFRNFEVWPAQVTPHVDYTLLTWVKSNYMVYDYCLDRSRYPVVPVDCV